MSVCVCGKRGQESQERFARRCEALAMWRWSNPWRIRVLMTACLLMLSSFAARSSSSSMGAVKSTFTRWIGFIMRPELVKKRETFLPLSAMRAMDSADAGFFLRGVFFIEYLFFPRCFPKGHQMVELSFVVFSNLKDHRIKPITYPADGAMLNRQIGTLVGVIRMKEHLLRFFEADSAPWIPPKAFALPRIKVEPHDDITVIPFCKGKRKGGWAQARPPQSGQPGWTRDSVP